VTRKTDAGCWMLDKTHLKIEKYSTLMVLKKYPGNQNLVRHLA
jgi:hypothetical protein